MRRLVLIALSCAFLTPAAAKAASLHPASIAADARWLLHLDLEAIESSEAIQETYRRRIGKQPFVRSLEEGRWNVEIDFEDELQAATLYGRNLSQTESVLLLHTEADQPKTAPRVPSLPGEKEIAYHGHQLHTWTWPEEKEPTLAVAFPKDGLTLWAADVQLLKAALDVIDGREASLDEKDAPLAAKPPQNAVFLVRAMGLKQVDFTDQIPLVQQLESFDYAEGVSDGRWFSSWTAVTSTPKVNRHMKSVVDGIVSAFWLLSEEETTRPQPEPRMNVSVDGPRIRVRLEAPLEVLAARFSGFWEWMYAERGTAEADSKKGSAKE
jgi:hypothetical protein